MQSASSLNIVTMLQASLSPITVISGVGLLLLSMTNRYGRVIDRVRHLLKDLKDNGLIPSDLKNSSDPKVSNQVEQINVLYKRAKVLRWSICFSLATLFLIALTIVFLFSSQLFSLDLSDYTCTSFIVALLALICSLLFLIQDIILSLNALKMEVMHFDVLS